MKHAHRLHERCACAASASAPFALPGVERKYERSRPFLVRHLFLDLSLDFQAKSVAGSAHLEIERAAPDADQIALDALGFELGAVRLHDESGARDAEFEYDGEVLTVLGLAGLQRARIEVEYRAQPRRGLYFLEPDEAVKDRPNQVWSQCQDEDARHWFPCHDKPHVKMTTELRVRVPAGLVALSNGNLVSADTPSSSKQAWTYHFKLERPHPSYLVTLVVGEFAIVNDRDAELAEGQRVPVQYYVPPARRKDTERSFGETPRMLELFSRLTGVPYPWGRYSQVVVSDFIFGGMENTTATTMYEHVLLDERAALDISSNDLVAHELAHQWFGDFVTCRDWSHAWLNEGFATFFEHVEREDRLGRDEYDLGIQADLGSYLSEAGSRYQRPIVCRDYVEPIDLFDRHLYEKGGLVLHMLRRELGDTLFWKGVQTYLGRHAHGIVETNNLQRALEDVSGRSFEQFFDQWVYRPGHPDLKVKLGYEDGLITVQVKQGQKVGETPVFAFQLEVEVRDKAGNVTRHTKSVSSANDTLIIVAKERPSYVGFDPELRVIGNITLEAPSDWLRRQLELGSLAWLRSSAAEALGKKTDLLSVQALIRSLQNEDEAWMVRAEAARALGVTRSPQALEALAKNIAITHPKVRRAVVGALGQFRKEAALQALLPVAHGDASYLVEAEAARSLGRTRQAAALEVLLSIMNRPSWADVIRMGTLDGLSALRDDAAVPAALERTRYGYPTRGRRAALSAVAHLGEGKRIREHLESLLDDADPHLRIEVINALVAFGDAKARSALRRATERELDGRVSRRLREALRDLGDSNSERRRVADDLEGLRGEISELKARLAKFEAKSKDEDSGAKNAEKIPKSEHKSEAVVDSTPSKQLRGEQKKKRRALEVKAAERAPVRGKPTASGRTKSSGKARRPR